MQFQESGFKMHYDSSKSLDACIPSSIQKRCKVESSRGSHTLQGCDWRVCHLGSSFVHVLALEWSKLKAISEILLYFKRVSCILIRLLKTVLFSIMHFCRWRDSSLLLQVLPPISSPAAPPHIIATIQSFSNVSSLTVWHLCVSWLDVRCY